MTDRKVVLVEICPVESDEVIILIDESGRFVFWCAQCEACWYGLPSTSEMNISLPAGRFRLPNAEEVALAAEMFKFSPESTIHEDFILEIAQFVGIQVD